MSDLYLQKKRFYPQDALYGANTFSYIFQEQWFLHSFYL